MNGPRPFFFVTSNPGKLREARSLLPIEIESLDLDLEEIQSLSVEEVSLHKLAQARRHVDGPVFVEDVALGFDSLGGFPGPFVKWLVASAGGAGVGKIAAGLERATGSAVCSIAAWDGASVHTFIGECPGLLLAEPRGTAGFGWDAWFQPEGFSLTYAEMASDEKATISHRARAYAKFSACLLSGSAERHA